MIRRNPEPSTPSFRAVLTYLMEPYPVLATKAASFRDFIERRIQAFRLAVTQVTIAVWNPSSIKCLFVTSFMSHC